jgi:hypothetical protein
VRLGGRKRDVHRGFVDDAIGNDRGRSSGGERPKDRRRLAPGDVRVGPRTLGRKRQAVEPGQQVKGKPEPGIRQLWEVGVEVDQPRQDDERAKIDDVSGGGRVRGRVATPSARER